MFNSKTSLDGYMKQWGASSTKMFFPYEFYNSIEEMRQTIDFPPYNAFFSHLRNSNIDVDDYHRARDEYNRRFALPDDHVDKYNNMADYLKVFIYLLQKKIMYRLTTWPM